MRTALPYYQRFTTAFPDVRRLAAAPVSRVMKLWEGLGYYRRAAHLREAARLIVRERGGRFPETAEGWRELPGVGEYTAGAVASIAYGERAPALDGNARRVLARLFAVPGDAGPVAFRRAIAERAAELVPPRAPGEFNQAVMELGARICLPRSPRCGECPVGGACLGAEGGDPERFPERTKRAPSPVVELVAGAVFRNGRVLLARRPAGGMLANLWECPGGSVPAGERREKVLARALREGLGMEVEVGERVARVRHVYSHLDTTLHLYRCEWKGKAREAKRGRGPRTGPRGDAAARTADVRPGATRARRRASFPAAGPWSETRWVEPARLHRFAVHVAARKAMAHL